MTPTGLGDAPDSLASILDHAPPVAGMALRADTRLTRPWGHGPLHDYLGGMQGDVIITYYGVPQQIEWRTGGDRLQGTTRGGSITIIPHGHDGHWDIAGPIGVSHVFLTRERLRSCAKLAGLGHVPELLPRVGTDDPVAARVMEMLGREADVTDQSSRLFVEQATDLLCTQLLRAHATRTIMAAPPRGGLAPWQLKKVTAYMRGHLGAEMGLDDLAAVAGLSRFHFCTAFRQSTGRTPHEMLVHLRIEKARQLLADARLSITDIGLAVGYGTPASFASAFRRVTGMTPSAYRRAL